MVKFEVVTEIFGVTLWCCNDTKTLLAMTMYDLLLVNLCWVQTRKNLTHWSLLFFWYERHYSQHFLVLLILLFFCLKLSGSD